MAKRYDPKMAKLLGACCVLAYDQYENDGDFKVPAGYSVAGAFKAPDTPFRNLRWRFKSRILKIIGFKLFTKAIVDAIDLFFRDVPFGFALRSKDGSHNLIAFRGTQDLADGLTDIDAFQVELPPTWRARMPGTDKMLVHLGFLLLTLDLHKQVLAAVERLDKQVPLYVTGHSLGGALTVLASLILRLHGFMDVRMYSFASPRVGNPGFADAYDQLVPESYRIVNLCDVVTEVPPSDIKGLKYKHVGKPWSFLNQSGDVLGNHGIDQPNNYIDAVNARIPTDKRRRFPSR